MLILIVLLPVALNAQDNSSEPISIHKSGGENMFYSVDGFKLPQSQVAAMLSTHDEAFREFRKARNNYNAGLVFGCAGGFLIGWELGGLLAGGNVNYAVLGAGAGLVVCGIPFISVYNKRSRKAIEMYNSSQISYMPRQDGLNLSVCMVPGGVGLALSF